MGKMLEILRRMAEMREVLDLLRRHGRADLLGGGKLGAMFGGAHEALLRL